MRISSIPRRTGLAAALALTAALSACSGSFDDESTAASAPQAATPEVSGPDSGAAATLKSAKVAAPAAPAAATAPGTGGTANTDIAAGADRKNARGVTVPDAALIDRDVIYTADLTVRVDDVSKAAAQIETAVRAAGGFVAGSERSTDASSTRSAATLTLRVPPGDFNSVLDRVAALGVLVERNLAGKDVTEAVIDVKSRIASARASVVRIRELMDRAVTLRDVVALEGELSQREADLDALLAKQAALKDQTSLATVVVHLQSPDAAAVAAEDDDKGFTAGLANGWDAFSGAATAGATVLGALVPFAVALLLLGPPLWWAGMRISRTAPTLRRKVSPIEPG